LDFVPWLDGGPSAVVLSDARFSTVGIAARGK
jgi:hypothetical protein